MILYIYTINENAYTCVNLKVQYVKYKTVFYDIKMCKF